MKPWAKFECPRCGATQQQRSGTEVLHPCSKATAYDSKKNGTGMVQLKEIKPS